MAKLVKCKSCGHEVARSAKVCPNCGARLQLGAGGGCAIILVVVLLIVSLAVLLGSGDDDGEPHKATGTTSAEPQTQTTFTIGEKAELNNIVVTLVDVSESNGGNFYTPSAGKVFVLCEFEIENNSKNDIAVSSIMSFEAYIDGYSTSMSVSAEFSSDKQQLDGAIASGKKMNGVIGYEADADWQEIEVRFTPNFWSGKDIVFTYSK